MSIEAVNQFLTKVSEDQELQGEVTKAMEAENDRQAVAELAAKHGYVFTPDEIGAEIQNRQSEFQTRQSENELSEEELEAVAGGLCTPAVAIGAAGFVASSAVNESGQW